MAALEAGLMSLAVGLGDQHNDLYIGSINYLRKSFLYFYLECVFRNIVSEDSMNIPTQRL